MENGKFRCPLTHAIFHFPFPILRGRNQIARLAAFLLSSSLLTLFAEGISSLSSALQSLCLHLLILDLLGSRGLRLGLDHLAGLALRRLFGRCGSSRRGSRARAGGAAGINVDFRSLDVNLTGSENYEGFPNLE